MTRRHGNRKMYSLLTSFASAWAANKNTTFKVGDVMPMITSVGYTSTKAKPIEELVWIHLRNLVEEQKLKTTTPFDHKTKQLDREWFV